MAKPQFNPKFTYANIGNVVGKLTYVKPLNRKDGSTFGYDFLLNVQGYGSVNVKVPLVSKAQQTLENFKVADKPTVRFNLTSVDTYLSQTGKWYYSLTTFNGAELPKDGMTDRAIGRVAGEVAKLGTDKDGNITFLLVVYQTDKDNKLIVSNKTGKPFEPKTIPVTIADPELKAQFKKEGITNGANIGVGYAFINKNDVGFDEFGFPKGDGGRITRIEGKKLVVYSTPEPVVEDLQVDPDPFGEVDPFAGGTEVDPFADDFDLPF